MDVFKKLILDLDTISKIPDGGKVSIHNEYISIDYPHGLQYLYRTLHGDNRINSILYIKERIDLAMMLFFMLGDEKKSTRLLIRNKLSDCICGLENLANTYKLDNNANNKIKTIINYVSHLPDIDA